ncbi:MAG: sodium/glutamate symporter [Pseudomonadota bacterium]
MPPAIETIEIDAFLALTAGIVVYFIGRSLTGRIGFLREFNIPEPVSGGLMVALGTLAVYVFLNREIVFDLQARDVLLVYFFTIVGLNARLSDLISGGRPLAFLLVITLVLMVVQNLVGALGATLFGVPGEAGVLLGTASLIGGHGTAIAWGPTIAEEHGVSGAAELGIASATVGLIMASLMGGPIARYLMERHNLSAAEENDKDAAFVVTDAEQTTASFDHVDLMRSILAIHLAVIIGYTVHQSMDAAGVRLPVFVPCLLTAIVLTNTIPRLLPGGQWPSRSPALALVSDFSLSIFLAMSLMSMQLWTLAGSAGVLVFTMALQALVTATFIIFIFFRVMGGNYFACVLSAGFAGFTLGATPTAIANMSAVTKRYGASPLAFIVLPLVSAFFVDLANAVLIQLFVGA